MELLELAEDTRYDNMIQQLRQDAEMTNSVPQMEAVIHAANHRTFIGAFGSITKAMVKDGMPVLLVARVNARMLTKMLINPVKWPDSKIERLFIIGLIVKGFVQ